jgi:hypothetical protein
MNAPNETELEVVALLDLLGLTLAGDWVAVFMWEGRASLDALDEVLKCDRAVAEARSRQALTDATRAAEQSRDERQQHSDALHAVKLAIKNEPRVVAWTIFTMLLDLVDRKPGEAALRAIKTFADASADFLFESFCLTVLAGSSFAVPKAGSLH